MTLLRIKTLQRRLMFFLLLPVTVVLLTAGTIGFIYIRNVLLGQWEESALLKLERAAHYINMRLAMPIERIRLISSANDVMTRQILLDDIRNLPGISEVAVEWSEATDAMRGNQRPEHLFNHRMMRFHRTRISKVSKPEFDADAGHKVVKIFTALIGKQNEEVGRLSITLKFDYLMEDISKLGWWQSDMACLVTREGTYLLHTNMVMDGRITLGDNGSPIEKSLLSAIAEQTSGTIMGSGHPPEMVAGYHSLSMAPWTIILYAPGETVLAPIVRFQAYFFFGSLLILIFTLFLIRINLDKLVGSIKSLSKSAMSVANGHYGSPVVSTTEDEMGQLVQSYNKMVAGLKERDFIRNTFGRYMDEDVARDLLKKPDAIKLGGDKREVVTLMSDIRGFTPLSETLAPEQTIRLLNNYFGHMIQIIKAHRGIIVDFVGDAVLVFFDPTGESIKAVAFRAACCAVEMQAEMVRFNKEMAAQGLPRLEMGIGLNSGEVIVGNIGSESRVKYGIVGSPVNLTHRIQEQAQGNEILVSERFHSYTWEMLAIGRCVTLTVKGVAEPINLFSIEGAQTQVSDGEPIECTAEVTG